MSTPFIGIYQAIYDYQAQNDEELTINENDLLYLLQKSEFDDWWLVKKRVLDANIDEPQGLVPKTYIQPAIPIHKAIALYDYTKQTDEELSFNEGSLLNIYDNSDPNWTLVDINNQQFGFVPGNYIQLQNDEINNKNLTPFPEPVISPINPTLNSSNNTQYFPPPPKRNDISPINNNNNNNNNNNDDDDDDELAPPMPTRPNNNDNHYNNYDNDNNGDYNHDDNNDDDESKTKSFFSPNNRSRSNTASSKISRRKSLSNLLSSNKDSDEIKPIHGDFAWKIHEIDGKKKRSGILEIGNSRIYLDIDNNKFSESWPISNLINYNSEKKHVFLDFKSPSYSFELHVGTKDSAQAIISILGDLKGMQSQSALSDLKNAQIEGSEAGKLKNDDSNYKKGIILYDFDGAADDELTCYEGENILIINDRKSKEWWMVENSKGRRGVVPSNYIKLISNKKNNNHSNNNNNNNNNSSGGFLKNLLGPNSKSPKKKSSKDKDREERELRDKARIQVERDELQRQRRHMELKEKELAIREKEQREQREKIRRADERLRERRMREDSRSKSNDNKNSNNNNNKNDNKDFSKPNVHRVRTWIDRSGAFKVEAEFLGLQQGKIHLHKTNGVKIAVAAQKLAVEDLEYVERLTGTSLEKYKPKATKSSPSPVRTSNVNESNNNSEATPSLPSRESSSAVARQRATSVPLRADLVDYWFNFCVEAGVDVAVCDRYARNFAQEQVDDSILDGVTPALMRTLGVREGDILKIKKKIDITLGKISNVEPVLGKNPTDPLPTTPSTGLSDDEWATKPAIKSSIENISNNVPIATPTKSLTPQITGSIQDLLNVKPMEPTRTGITPIKPVSTIGLSSNNDNNNNFSPVKSTNNELPLQKTGITSSLTGNTTQMPMMAMPTGFMPITMVPMLTGMTTGMMPLRTGGGLTTGLTGGMPMTSFGVNSLAQQQKTGGAFILPLNTGSIMPNTTFGNNMTMMGQQTGNLVKLQPTGVRLQQTGAGFSTIPAMQPTMKTGGGFIPQSNFGLQLNNAMTGGAMMNPLMTGGLPQTSFGGLNPAMTGGLPQTSFGGINPAITGGLPQTSFGGINPAMTGGFGNGIINPAMTGGFGNGMINPAMTGGLPPTSFGAPTQQLQSQPTGFGFGNSFNGSGASKQANLANATADNPFGF